MIDTEKKMFQELIERQETIIKELARITQNNLAINTLLRLEKEVLTSSDDISVVKAAKADVLEEAVRRIKNLGEDANGSNKQSQVENVC